MKKFFVILSMLLSLFAISATAGNATVYSLEMRGTGVDGGTSCPGCQFVYEDMNTGAIGTVSTGTYWYCSSQLDTYRHFQYGPTNCYVNPYWRNAYAIVSTSTPHTWSVYLRQQCVGSGGWHVSASRSVYVDRTAYFGFFQPTAACVTLGAAELPALAIQQG